jgi:hypothetical protein
MVRELERIAQWTWQVAEAHLEEERQRRKIACSWKAPRKNCYWLGQKRGRFNSRRSISASASP